MSSPEEITNAKIEKLIPEIEASKYGKYPMHGIRWLHVTEDTSPDGEPCYIKGPYEGPKTNYVFGPGTFGQLYYHLLTKQSYVILSNRLRTTVPTTGCTCFASIEQRQELKDHTEVSHIIYLRAKASIPDDEQARNDNLQDARAEAEMLGEM